jgi:hypothetical protein
MPRLFVALQTEDRYPILDIIDQTPEIPDNCQWALFLRNHDDLTLSMVTDEERDYLFRALANDPGARREGTVRRKLGNPLGEGAARKTCKDASEKKGFQFSGTPVGRRAGKLQRKRSRLHVLTGRSGNVNLTCHCRTLPQKKQPSPGTRDSGFLVVPLSALKPVQM